VKLKIGLKIAILSAILVVVTVATTTGMWYRQNHTFLVEQGRGVLEHELGLEAAHLRDAVLHLQNDGRDVANDARSQRNLNPDLRPDDVKRMKWTENKFRNFMADSFRNSLTSGGAYSDLRLIKGGATGPWVVYVQADRMPRGDGDPNAPGPADEDAAVRVSQGVRTTVSNQPVADEADLENLRTAAKVASRKRPYLTRVKVENRPGGDAEPALVLECIAPVFQTLDPGAGKLLGFLSIKADLTPVLTAHRGTVGGPDRLFYLADEQGTVLAAWPAAAGGKKVQDLYPGLNEMFQGPAGPAQHRIDYWANPGRHVGQCVRVNFELDENDPPGHPVVLAVAMPYSVLAAKALPDPLPLLLLAGALIAVAAGLAYWFGRVLTRPLQAITAAADDLARARFDVSLPVEDQSEVGVLARAFRHMVDQLRKRGRALRESEAQTRAILDTAAEGIITIDERGTVQTFNQAAERIFGYAADEVKGQSAQVFLSDAHLEEIGGDVEKYLRTVADSTLGTTTEHLGRRKDGSTFPMEMSVSAVNLRGQPGPGAADPGEPAPESPSGVIRGRRLFTYIVRDVTERRRAEENIHQLNESLERRVRERTLALAKANEALELARDQANEANRAKSTFLAQMSHELRTPLNAIIGYSELLQEEAEAEGRQEFVPDLRKIVDAGNHLLTLINDVLDLSKIEAGKMELCVEPFELAPLVGSVVSTIAPLADKNANTLEVSCPAQVGVVRSDPTRVRQVLFNLLSNACKFTSRGKVSLEVTRATVDGADWVTLTVRDTGRGIKAAELGKIFQPFVQGDASTTRQYGGTGLGLAISQRFCRMMGGEITVESEWGKGSTFTVRLPAEPGRRPAAPAAPTTAAPAAPAAARREPAGSNPVLVVDDDMAVRDLLQRFLTKEGFQVLTASSGEEGLQLAKQLRPSAITLDVLMPGMDGWSVLTSLKADPETSDIPVIMLTILDNKNLGHSLGATDYLTKPLDRARLAALLRKYQDHPAGREILLVEDEADTREMLRRSLEKGGWTVTEAANGRAALEEIARKPPGLILLDLMMPEMDGFEMLEELRARPEWRSIPVVVITAKELSEEDRLRLSGSLLLSGCVRRVLKKGQYRREDLLREVRELMAVHTEAPPGGPGAES
jgi:PAS domain S-box-containing protein